MTVQSTVAPAQRDQLAVAQAGHRRHPVERAVDRLVVALDRRANERV
jgi:hypothetical protein